MLLKIGFDLMLICVLKSGVFTSSVSETEIGEPPHVAEADCVTDHGQEKVQFAAPLLPLRLTSGPSLASLRRSQVSSLRVVKYVFELKHK